MNAIRAIVKVGRLELQAPPDWPDGTEVLIEFGLNVEPPSVSKVKSP